MGKTTVSRHPRKGTRGVKKHRRFVPSKDQKVVPVSEVPDKVIREIQNLSDEGEKLYKQEWALNKKYADTLRELDRIDPYKQTARFKKLRKRKTILSDKQFELKEKRRKVTNKMFKLAEKHGILHDLTPFRDRSYSKYWRL